ncbi:hypothetical protein B296_00040207 [Ensete ventricosum]|uniref:Uncharacterized protein n=1 Tax=Ensete ventricosum TaxID=4639 RepID=A0A426YHA1_ENSVE|nr:hypothetical protein B296_00040207 [Ensete ventricosum]
MCSWFIPKHYRLQTKSTYGVLYYSLPLLPEVLQKSQHLRSLHMFQHGRELDKVIKEALSKVFSNYYPFIWQFIDSEHDDVHVAYSGEGTWFEEAEVNYSLEDEVS